MRNNDVNCKSKETSVSMLVTNVTTYSVVIAVDK